MSKNSKKILYIDMDGTITNEPHQYHTQYELSTPNKRMIEKINKCFDLGYILIIYTARHKEDMKLTNKWLKKNKVKYHDIIFNKPLGLYYIDDKNLSINQFLNKKF